MATRELFQTTAFHVGLGALSALSGFAMRIAPTQSMKHSIWRHSLSMRIVDPKYSQTDAWLRDAIENDPSFNLRITAGEAWVQIAADPESASDIDFAFHLIEAPRGKLSNDEWAYRRARGFEVLERHVRSGHFDRRIFDLAAVEIRSEDGRDKVSAIHVATAFTEPSFRDEILELLNHALSDPKNVESRGSAQRSLKRLTGHAPHYEGEIACDIHPLVIHSLNGTKARE
jgi:hypothetical protein